MKLAIPQNIYSALFSLILPTEFREEVIIKPSSVLANTVENGEADIALIPSLDLNKHKELFVSSKAAIACDGQLANAYYYFVPEQSDFKKVLMHGDVSTNEIILSKIIFKELYGVDVEIALNTAQIDFNANNYLVVGQENNLFLETQNGISFADQASEFFNKPYVNFVLVAKNEETIQKVNESLTDLDKKLEDKLNEYLPSMGLSAKMETMIAMNIGEVYFELTENEKEALTDLLRLPFYHGIFKEIVDIKFV